MRPFIGVAVVLLLAACASSPTALQPGRYARPDLVPGVSLEVGDGWSSAVGSDGSIAVQHAVGEGTVVVMLAHVDAASAGAAAGRIPTVPGIEVLASSDSRMSGRTGANHELENTTDGRIDLVDFASGAVGSTPSAVSLGADERMWLSLFDTTDGVLAVIVTAPVAAWDAALLAAEPVLESVLIGE